MQAGTTRLLIRSVTGWRPNTIVYSPEGTRAPPMAATAFWAASTPASSVNSSRRVPVDQPEPLACRASTMAVTNAVISVDSSVCTRGMAVEIRATRSCNTVTSPPRMRPRPRIVIVRQRAWPRRWPRQRDELGIDDGPLSRLGQRALGAAHGEVGRLAAEADARPAVSAREHDLKAQAVRGGRLRLLHAVGRDVRRVVQASEQRGVGGREHFDLGHARLGADELEGVLGRLRQVGGRHTRLTSGGRAPPCPPRVSRARTSRADPRR